ncbi:MAG: DUF21 domain-containing protein [Candidatus Heimdallarchaeota archaeon]|nr:DUF21 domain-containing protein [Candidatus Heimdallarchaeota archaeon]
MRTRFFGYFLLYTVVYLILQVSGSGAPPVTEVTEATTADYVALFLYIFLAIFFSFTCSIAEAVLLNINPSFMADLKDKNPGFAKRVTKIRVNDIEQSLAAILTMNTIAHTIGSIGSGAKATIVFGIEWFGVFSVIMTLMILIFSEIIPKTVGVVYWRGLSRSVIYYIQFLNFILFPVIWVSEKITKMITKGREAHVFNRDEFIAMAGVGVEAGAFKEHESKIIQNLFRMSSLTAEDIFTPRTVIKAYDEKKTIEEVFRSPGKFPFTRMLVFDGNLDNVTGFVLKDELLLHMVQNEGNQLLKDHKRDIEVVQKDTTVTKLFDILVQSNKHIVLVVDEFTTKGIVTLEDVLETLLGMEIVDEDDDVADMQLLARQVWEKRMERLGYQIHQENEDEE